MGGVTPAPKEGLVAWTGGLPKFDWSGLFDPATSYMSPNQHRSFFSEKSYNYRRTRLLTKFKKGDDLITFQEKTFKHLKDSVLQMFNGFLLEVD